MSKVLHVVYQSYPNISGSSTRTNHILNAQKIDGIEPVVISSPGQQPEKLSSRVGVENINSIKYYRTYIFEGLSVGGSSTALDKVKKVLSFPYFVYKLWKVCSIEKPNVIHAHAMFYCAIAALIVGNIKGIPVVYEIRSLWYINPNSEQLSILKKIAIKLECIAIKRSDAVVAISDGIKSEFSKLRSDIYIVRNAVNAEDNSIDIASINGISKFAYIGSVIDLEGIDKVIKAFSLLRDTNPQLEFHVFGSGPKLEELKRLAKSLKSPTTFHGQVPPSEIRQCYQSMDCIINYRNDEPIAHLVTPLKPLEAILLNKPLICSEVGGYLEIIGGIEHAMFVPPNDIDALARAIVSISNPENEEIVSTQMSKAKAFVLSNRLWSTNVNIYKRIYSKLEKI
ncbi:TPA: glycosyltransferase [Vibrio vulnificus]|nr:glycosyltransferase [Vibrio vulnificus]